MTPMTTSGAVPRRIWRPMMFGSPPERRRPQPQLRMALAGGAGAGADLAADDVRIAAEAPLPEVVADDHLRRRAGLVVLRHEEAAEVRLDGGDGEEVVRHESAVEALRLG